MTAEVSLEEAIKAIGKRGRTFGKDLVIGLKNLGIKCSTIRDLKQKVPDKCILYLRLTEAKPGDIGFLNGTKIFTIQVTQPLTLDIVRTEFQGLLDTLRSNEKIKLEVLCLWKTC